MNIRIHSFKVYLVMTVSSMKYWTFRKPTEEHSNVYGDTILQTKTLWDLLYLAREGTKTETGKCLVRKSDLEFLLTEIAGTGGLEEIAEFNK